MALTFTKAIEEVEQPSVDPAALTAWLRKNAPEIAALVEKDMTASDVHATTALGNEKDRRRRGKTFKDKISAITDPPGKPAAVVETAEKLDGEWDLPFQVIKAEPDRQLVFGWASIATEGGKPIIDKQDDVILPEDLEAAAYDFVLYSRTMGDMHEKRGVGRIVESMVFTKEKQEALGIDLGIEGWWVGWKVDDPETWSAIRAGRYPEFSIGGRGERVAI